MLLLLFHDFNFLPLYLENISQLLPFIFNTMIHYYSISLSAIEAFNLNLLGLLQTQL